MDGALGLVMQVSKCRLSLVVRLRVLQVRARLLMMGRWNPPILAWRSWMLRCVYSRVNILSCADNLLISLVSFRLHGPLLVRAWSTVVDLVVIPLYLVKKLGVPGSRNMNWVMPGCLGTLQIGVQRVCLSVPVVSRLACAPWMQVVALVTELSSYRIGVWIGCCGAFIGPWVDVACVSLKRRVCLVLLSRRVAVIVLSIRLDILVRRLCLNCMQHLVSILVSRVILLWCSFPMCWPAFYVASFVRLGATCVCCDERKLCILVPTLTGAMSPSFVVRLLWLE